MSGQLVGGVIGAAIGFFAGGNVALGWAIGSAIGGAVAPGSLPDKVGPRLTDLRPQSSEYGRPLTIIAGGTVGIAGTVIWAAPLFELQQVTEQGGKGGGPTQNTIDFSYYSYFAVAVCEGPKKIGRIWAGPEKRLIYAGAGFVEGGDFGFGAVRCYEGTEDQLPDPLLEFYLGVGNVPAYRGTCYVVFQNFPVVNDGNRIPFLTIEVGNVDTTVVTAPPTLGTQWIQRVFKTDDNYIVLYYGSYRGFMVRSLADNHLIGNFTYPSWDVAEAQYFIDEDRNKLVLFSRNSGMYYHTYNMATGELVEHNITVSPGGDANPGTYIRAACYHNGMYLIMGTPMNGLQSTALYLLDPDTDATIDVYTYSGITNFVGPLLPPIDASNYVTGFTYPNSIWKFGFATNDVTDMGDCATIELSYTEAIAAIDPRTGYVWSLSNISGVQTAIVTDTTTGVQINSHTTDQFYEFATAPFMFIDGTPNEVVVVGERWLAKDQLWRFNANTTNEISTVTGAYMGTARLHAALWNDVTNKAMGFRYSAWVSIENTPMEWGNLDYYLGEADESVSLALPTTPLDEVVISLSEMAGISAENIDATDLEDDEVEGYAIAKRTSVRSALEPLRQAYYFDAVESNGKVKFVKRGGAVVRQIDDGDLSAHNSGSEPDDPLTTVRQMEDEMPQRVSVNYLLAASKYGPATKEAVRKVGSSEEATTLELPLVLNDTKAQEVADVNLHVAWSQRLSYTFDLSREHADLEPTDVISVKGHTMRITKIVDTPTGVRKVSAVRDGSHFYEPHVIVTETPPPTESVTTVDATILEIM